MLVRLGDALAAELGDRPGADPVPRHARRRRPTSSACRTTATCSTPIPLMSAAGRRRPSVAGHRRRRARHPPGAAAHGRVDVLHLRMADVGSLAASGGRPASWASRRVHPGAGPARRHPCAGHDGAPRPVATSARSTSSEHYWFRARLVQPAGRRRRTSARCSRARSCGTSCGTCSASTSTSEPHRYTVVPEGIDLTVSEAARPEDELARTARGRGAPATTLAGARSQS